MRDKSYQDPNVWLFEISADTLEWKSMELPYGHLTNEIHVLRCRQSGALNFFFRPGKPYLASGVKANGFMMMSGLRRHMYLASSLRDYGNG